MGDLKVYIDDSGSFPKSLSELGGITGFEPHLTFLSVHKLCSLVQQFEYLKTFKGIFTCGVYLNYHRWFGRQISKRIALSHHLKSGNTTILFEHLTDNSVYQGRHPRKTLYLMGHMWEIFLSVQGKHESISLMRSVLPEHQILQRGNSTDIFFPSLKIE